MCTRKTHLENKKMTKKLTALMLLFYLSQGIFSLQKTIIIEATDQVASTNSHVGLVFAKGETFKIQSIKSNDYASYKRCALDKV